MIVIEKFSGLVTNASPYAVPPTSAATQVNIQCLVPGELSVRKGLTTATSAAATAVIHCFHYQGGTVSKVIVQDASGAISVVTGF
jgi:hypothetical protein